MKKKKPLSKREVLSKGPTPMEVKIYNIVKSIHKETGLPVAAGQIKEVTETHRTGILVHLTKMINKGLIVKSSHKFYLPA